MTGTNIHLVYSPLLPPSCSLPQIFIYCKSVAYSLHFQTLVLLNYNYTGIGMVQNSLVPKLGKMTNHTVLAEFGINVLTSMCATHQKD